MPPASQPAFISYSRKDAEFAMRLAEDLKSAGAAVWLDLLELKPGIQWDNAIEDALMAAPQMLLVLTPESARSENVRNEISYALEQGKVIIPVLYMDCVVPLRLQRTQRIDFRTDYAHGLNALLRHLQITRPEPQIVEKVDEQDAERQGQAQREAEAQAREAEAQRLKLLADRKQQQEKEEADRRAAEIAASLQRQADERQAREAQAREAKAREAQAREEAQAKAQRLHEQAWSKQSEQTEQASSPVSSSKYSKSVAQVTPTDIGSEAAHSGLIPWAIFACAALTPLASSLFYPFTEFYAGTRLWPAMGPAYHFILPQGILAVAALIYLAWLRPRNELLGASLALLIIFLLQRYWLNLGYIQIGLFPNHHYLGVVFSLQNNPPLPSSSFFWSPLLWFAFLVPAAQPLLRKHMFIAIAVLSIAGTLVTSLITPIFVRPSYLDTMEGLLIGYWPGILTQCLLETIAIAGLSTLMILGHHYWLKSEEPDDEPSMKYSKFHK